MMRIYLTLCVLITALFLTGCSSVMKSGMTGRSLADHLPSRNPTIASANENDSFEMLFGMARVAERNDRSEQAVSAYHEILAEDSSHVPALHRLGVIAARQGHVDEAMDYFMKAVELEEPSAELLGDIGYAQYLANDYDSAAATLQKAIYKSPDNKRIINNLAIVMGMQQRYGDSLDLFRQTGSEAESLAAVAFTQSQTGQLEQAKATYHRSLEIDSSLEVAANGLLELDRVSRSAQSDSDSSADTQIANRTGIDVAFPGDSSQVRTGATIRNTESTQKSRGVFQSLAATVRGKSDSNNKIAKPPVIAMRPTETSDATNVRQTVQASRSDLPTARSAATGSTARIVMTPPAAVPVAQLSIGQSQNSVSPERMAQSANPADQTSPSSRRASSLANPTEPSFVRQVGYEEPVGSSPRR